MHAGIREREQRKREREREIVRGKREKESEGKKLKKYSMQPFKGGNKSYLTLMEDILQNLYVNKTLINHLKLKFIVNMYT